MPFLLVTIYFQISETIETPLQRVLMWPIGIRDDIEHPRFIYFFFKGNSNDPPKLDANTLRGLFGSMAPSGFPPKIGRWERRNNGKTFSLGRTRRQIILCDVTMSISSYISGIGITNLMQR